MKRFRLACAIALFAPAISAPITPALAQDAPVMRVSFSWAGIPPCSTVSPAFAVNGAPKGTASLRFSMRDYDAPDFDHGGSTLPYTGRKIPQGVIKYVGPCPPEGQAHRYIWKIEALDSSGAALMAITVSAGYPPK